MEPATSILAGKKILVVDDEKDILETIEDILDEAKIDTATDYDTASFKIKTSRYDLAILDIMGVNGLDLLDEAVAREIPTVMLTAHAVNKETLMASIRKGAIGKTAFLAPAAVGLPAANTKTQRAVLTLTCQEIVTLGTVFA